MHIDENYGIPSPGMYYELGDWVQAKTGLYGEQRTPPMYVVAVFSDLLYTEVDCEQGDPFEYEMKDVVPIEITKEMTDANTLMNTNEHGVKVSLFREDGEWVLTLRSKGGDVTKKVKHVHEIQHILRLFGVHKTIRL